jgi:hypothetical protein
MISLLLSTGSLWLLSLIAAPTSLNLDVKSGRLSISTPEEVGEDAISVNCQNGERLGAVRILFEKMGAQASDIAIEKFNKADNLVLRKQGKSEELIVIGAHYDIATLGCGAIDNWSGIVAMAHVYRSRENLEENYVWTLGDSVVRLTLSHRAKGFETHGRATRPTLT